MEQLRIRPGGVLSSLLLAAAILLLTTFGADSLRNSELYSKSRLISMILSQDSVGIRNLAADRRNVEMLFKFVGAVTSAYIDFELIPVGEAATFAAVFESTPAAVKVDRFEYHGKNLTITGSAPDEIEYEAFIGHLEESAYFESATGSYYTTTEDDIRFEINCTSRNSVGAALLNREVEKEV